MNHRPGDDASAAQNAAENGADADMETVPKSRDDEDIVVYDEYIDDGAEDVQLDNAAAEAQPAPDDAVHVFRAHTAETLAVSCNSADPNMIASGSCDDRAILFDVQQRRELAELDGQGESVSCVQFSHDGKYLATGSENGAISVMFLQGAPAPQSVLDGPSEAITFLAWHPRGAVLLAGSEDKSAYMWNAAKGLFMMAFVGHEGGVTSGFFTRDGKKVVTAARDSSVRMWNPTTGATIARIQANQPRIGGTFHAEEINALAIGNANSPLAYIAASGSADGAVYVSNLESGQVVSQLPGHEGGVETLAFSPPGVKPAMLASAGADGTIRVRDMENGSERCTFTHAGVIAKVLWHATLPILVSGSSSGTLCVWNVLTGAKAGELRGHADFISDVCFACDHAALVSTSGDGTVRVFDVRSLAA